MTSPAERYGLPKPRAPWGDDGNAFFIMGAVRRALRDAGYPPAALTAYSEESTSGDYDHVLQTALLWCDEGRPKDDDDADDDADAEMCEECGETLLYCEC